MCANIVARLKSGRTRPIPLKEGVRLLPLASFEVEAPRRPRRTHTPRSLQFQPLMSILPRSTGFVGTRVARKTLAAFLLAALVPAVVVAYVGISQVRSALTNQSRDNIVRASSAASVTLLEQLTTLASAEAMRMHGIAGKPVDYDDAPDAYTHLINGNTLLDHANADSPIQFRHRTAANTEIHWAYDAATVWKPLDRLLSAQRFDYCVFETRTWRRLHCSPLISDTVAIQQLRELTAIQKNGTSAITDRWVLASQDVFLRTLFAAEPWRITVVESRAVIVAPAKNSATTFVWLLVIALLTAFALGHVQIRRSTKPLEALRDATQAVMAGDFDVRVPVKSNDEYGALATAFNAMISAIGRQITLMHGLDAVDDATLHTRRSDAIIDAALERFHTACRSDRIRITTLDNDVDDAVTIVEADSTSPTARRSHGQMHNDKRQRLLSAWSLDHRIDIFPTASETAAEQTAAAESSLNDASPVRPARSEKSITLPLRHYEELLGVIELEVDAESAESEEIAIATRRLADRVALGLATVRFLDQLEALSTGTLLAFARTIDANSQWTAGHSERVTGVAVQLGKALEVSDADIERLHRGGLMHDIGKIGVPASILDKAERLTPEEFEVIKRHPEIGEQILKVVPAFRDILCIVRSHHEQFDGRGYPDGLVGEAIPFLARIAAVADVYDALASDRPYRSGLSSAEAIDVIVKGSGTHFDPVVVAALLRVHATGVLNGDPETAQAEVVDYTIEPLVGAMAGS